MALTILVVDSVALIFAPNVYLLIVLRFIQGFMGAAGVVLSRAIAPDVSSGAETVRALSLIATLVGLGHLRPSYRWLCQPACWVARGVRSARQPNDANAGPKHSPHPRNTTGR